MGTQPATTGGESIRTQQAVVVRRQVEQILAADPKARVVLVGDFNELEFAEPMQRLAGSTLVNLIEKVPKAERYTYNFEGLSQAIDHGLVAGHMAESSELEIVHLNADFTERSSDHDAFVMRVAVA